MNIGLLAFILIVGELHTAIGRCPTGGTNWYENNGMCYKFFRKEETWDQARLQCAFEIPDADLVTIASEEELVYVHTMVHAQTVVGCGKRYWIGLSDRDSEQTFRWVDDTAAGYTNWDRREPNNAFGEDCVEMGYDHGTWNDEDCQRNRCFVCEVASLA